MIEAQTNPYRGVDTRDQRPVVAVAGASGFIGTALCPRLADDYRVLALTRSPARANTPDPNSSIVWRHCDLFSLPELTAALAGVDFAVWLVHSLAPSSRLTQARPRDLDLALADNFARAAAANGIRQILCIGAVLPPGYRIAPLLWSRREVELVLASQGTPVTALRASLVIGPGGTGPALLLDLVRRLPVLLLPAAAQSITRPIALADLVRAILLCLGEPARYRGAFDVGGAELLSYADMLTQTAAVLGRRRRLLSVPLLPLWLVGLVARLASGAPATMTGAIVEALPEALPLQDNPVQRAIQPAALGFQAALTTAIDPEQGRLRPNPRRALQPRDRILMRQQARVRSIQRVIMPPGQTAAWVAGNYFRWLGRCCWPLVQTRIADDGSVSVGVRLPRLTLLHLVPERAASSPARQVYRVAGGLLARRAAARADSEAIAGSQLRPRFEFQALLDGRYTMTAIHDYAPALPWYLYLPTQALAHRWVMARYQRRLARLTR